MKNIRFREIGRHDDSFHRIIVKNRKKRKVAVVAVSRLTQSLAEVGGINLIELLAKKKVQQKKRKSK